MTTPNPGSKAAVEQGCTCPVYDNAHGLGSGYLDDVGKPVFWINTQCVLHGVMNDKRADTSTIGYEVAPY